MPLTQAGCRGRVTAGHGTTGTAKDLVWIGAANNASFIVASAACILAKCDRLGSLGNVSECKLLPSPYRFVNPDAAQFSI